MDIPPNLEKHFSDTLNSLIKDGCWHLPPEFACQPDIKSRIKAISSPIIPLGDQLVWKHYPDGLLVAKLVFNFLNPPSTVVPSADMIWRNYIPPSSSFTFWRALDHKLHTDENLRPPGSCGCLYLCSYFSPLLAAPLCCFNLGLVFRCIFDSVFHNTI